MDMFFKPGVERGPFKTPPNSPAGQGARACTLSAGEGDKRDEPGASATSIGPGQTWFEMHERM